MPWCGVLYQKIDTLLGQLPRVLHSPLLAQFPQAQDP